MFWQCEVLFKYGSAYMPQKSKNTDALAIEIFRPGKFTPMAGKKLSFSAEDVSATAENYNPEIFKAPIVIGHPKHDHPAYGWVTGLKFGGGDDDIMVAYLDQVDPKFAEAVEAGKFKKISASFYPPNHADNPVPDTYYLKHVGFLGAAAPAVSGLSNVEFSQDDELLLVEFGALHDIASLFDRMRDFFIDQFGIDKADDALPKWQLGWLKDEAVRQEATENETQLNNFSDHEEDDETMATKTELEAKLQERETKLKAREAAADTRETQFSEHENETYIESKIADGIMLPVQKTNMVAFMNALGVAGTEPVAFADANGVKSDVSLIDGFKALVEDMSPVVEFGEAAPNGADAPTVSSFVAPSDSIVDKDGLNHLAKADAYALEHGVSFTEAAIATEAA